MKRQSLFIPLGIWHRLISDNWRRAFSAIVPLAIVLVLRVRDIVVICSRISKDSPLTYRLHISEDDAKLVCFFQHKEKKIARYTLRYIGYNPMFGKYIRRYNELTNLCVATSSQALNKAAHWHKHKSHFVVLGVRQRTFLATGKPGLGMGYQAKGPDCVPLHLFY